MHNPLLRKNFKAGADVNKYRIVKFGTDDDTVIQAAVNTDGLMGVNGSIKIDSGEKGDIVVAGIAEVEYGGTVTRGDLLTSDANGKAVSITTAAREADEVNVIGVAMKSGSSGDIGSVLIAPAEFSLAIDDAVSASAAELDEYVLNVEIPDISTAQSVWVVAPHAGDIVKIETVLFGAISGADAVVTAEIGGTLVTGSSITIANAGSAAGDVDSASPTAANAVTAGQAIEIITDGGSTGAVAVMVSITISR